MSAPGGGGDDRHPAILADLVLPWERQRLVAVVQRVTARAVAAGRAPFGIPPEERAP